MRQRHKEKLKRKQRRIKNRVTIRTLFLLIITLIFNTYAWFTYFNTISAGITAHVDKWHVLFRVDNEVVDRQFTIQIPHAYPGMQDVEKIVTIINDGEKDADIEYALKYVRIFDDIYVASDHLEAGETVPTGATLMNSSQIHSMIENDYPFYLSVATLNNNNNNTVSAETQAQLRIAFTWAYESGDDETDTTYGTTAYDFYAENPGREAIEIVVKVMVTQHNETVTPTPELEPEP